MERSENEKFVSFNNSSQNQEKYLIRCDNGETPEENTIYIDYKFNEIRLCGTIPGNPLGEKKVNTALEACKEYLRKLACFKKNTDIYEKVLNHIKYNKSPNYVELASFCEKQLAQTKNLEEQEK